VFLASIIATFARHAPRRSSSKLLAALRHLGAPGFFLLAVLDSSPLPTFGGPDILTAVLSARHGEPWYYYALLATAGSLVGAYITFRLARRAGKVFLHRMFGERRAATFTGYFERWGTGALVVSTATPVPFPTSAFFAIAGVLNYPLRTFLIAVTLSRALRYAVIAAVSYYYGRRFIRVLLHPGQYLGWFLLISVLLLGFIAFALFVRKWVLKDGTLFPTAYELHHSEFSAQDQSVSAGRDQK